MFPVIRNAPGGKGARCVRLTTYHHYSADVMKTRSLNSPGPLRASMACSGMTLPLFIIIIGGILVLFIYITRLASNEIFSPSNKIHREVGRDKDLSAPQYFDKLLAHSDREFLFVYYHYGSIN